MAFWRFAGFDSRHRVMTRSVKGKKGPGFDFMSNRWGNRGGCNLPAKDVKALTNRAERRIRRKQIQKGDHE